MTHTPGHGAPAVQFVTTTAEPCAGGVAMTRLEQLIEPHVVVSFWSTGMLTEPPAHTFALSAPAMTPHTLTCTWAVPILPTLSWIWYVKTSTPVKLGSVET